MPGLDLRRAADVPRRDLRLSGRDAGVLPIKQYVLRSGNRSGELRCLWHVLRRRHVQRENVRDDKLVHPGKQRGVHTWRGEPLLRDADARNLLRHGRNSVRHV
jgi:hypothetical protein